MPEEQKTPLPDYPIRDDLDDNNPVERAIKAALRREHGKMCVGTAERNRHAAIARTLEAQSDVARGMETIRKARGRAR